MITTSSIGFGRRHLFQKLQLLKTVATKIDTLDLGLESLPIHLKTTSPDSPAVSRDTMSAKLRSSNLWTMSRGHIPISRAETLATCRRSFQILLGEWIQEQTVSPLHGFHIFCWRCYHLTRVWKDFLSNWVSSSHPTQKLMRQCRKSFKNLRNQH